MQALFCGVTCALDSDGTLMLDPTAKQEKVGVKTRVTEGLWPGGSLSLGLASLHIPWLMYLTPVGRLFSVHQGAFIFKCEKPNSKTYTSQTWNVLAFVTKL
jgi:hypothetical protein